jgi:hypothetical protein
MTKADILPPWRKIPMGRKPLLAVDITNVARCDALGAVTGIDSYNCSNAANCLVS